MLTKYGEFDGMYGITISGRDFHKFGRNPVSRNLIEDVVWSQGGENYPWPEKAEVTTVFSSSAADGTLVGVGCSKVKVFGLDANYEEISEEIEINGIVGVTLVNKFLRVYRMYNSSDKDAQGNIQARHGSVVLAEILGSRNQTEMCIYTVPAGKKLYISQMLVASEGNKEVTYTLWAREVGGVFRVQQNFAAYGQGYSIQNNPVLKFKEKTDIYVSGTNKGANDVVIAELFGALVKQN